MSSIVATWAFSAPGVVTAASILTNGGGALDAVEHGIHAVELDTRVTSAGYGGLPNALGRLQLDAALMTDDGRIGAVMALEGFRAAVPAARRVLDHSPHSILGGDGAAAFASAHGMVAATNAAQLLSPHAKNRYKQFRNGEIGPGPHRDHATMPHTDTVGMIARDADGRLAAGCATSGMQFKAPGRVGDSPIVGAGLYADEVGAAVASGDGDQMLRFCIAFLVVEQMRGGEEVQQACEAAMRRVHAADPKCQAAVTGMSPDGGVGAAATHGGFRVVRWRAGTGAEDVQNEEARAVSETTWKHSCV